MIGGDVIITAGNGTSTNTRMVATAWVQIFGGEALGKEVNIDWGGNVKLPAAVRPRVRACPAPHGHGLLVWPISIVTANAGVRGVSGSLAFSSGTTSRATPVCHDRHRHCQRGQGWRHQLEVGKGIKGDGGNILISAGERPM